MTCRYRVESFPCGHPIVVLPKEAWLAYFEKKGGGVCADCPLRKEFEDAETTPA